LDSRHAYRTAVGGSCLSSTAFSQHGICDGTYRLVSSTKVNPTYTSRKSDTAPCPDRKAGPLGIADVPPGIRPRAVSEPFGRRRTSWGTRAEAVAGGNRPLRATPLAASCERPSVRATSAGPIAVTISTGTNNGSGAIPQLQCRHVCQRRERQRTTLSAPAVNQRCGRVDFAAARRGRFCPVI
jgi:hypothetical protein